MIGTRPWRYCGQEVTDRALGSVVGIEVSAFNDDLDGGEVAFLFFSSEASCRPKTRANRIHGSGNGLQDHAVNENGGPLAS